LKIVRKAYIEAKQTSFFKDVTSNLLEEDVINMIVIIDFGSQTTHLIGRRLKDLGVKTEIISPLEVNKFLQKNKPQGIILSGGPASVYEKGAPTITEKIFDLQIPILGICYGFQLISKLLGGKVIAGKKEYGPAIIEISGGSTILHGLESIFTVWMSHGDEITKLPKGFEVLGKTKTMPYAFVQNITQNIYGLQFHPEAEHTEFGTKILENFAQICGEKIIIEKINIQELVKSIQETVKDSYVIGAISGGVDSTVAGTLTATAIGKKFIPVYVDNGLMRDGTTEFVRTIFKKFGIKPIIIDAKKEMLSKLKGIIDPEKKRKIIGNFYIELFERELEKLSKTKRNIQFLLQGTIYSDVIESQGTKHASKIKSHHNVGGLPKNMKLKLLEPVRYFYKDEVRNIGKQLKLSDEFIHKQPFPGPGYAIRIRGEITAQQLEKQRIADNIILEELQNANLLSKVFISFPVLTGAFSTAVKGDGRFFGEVVALRIVESADVMTSSWAKIPYDVLQKISSRIVNEAPHVSRVVYDITTKPPATMEWE
jgi:GMP synthase (glutamine-hydrolysing)